MSRFERVAKSEERPKPRLVLQRMKSTGPSPAEALRKPPGKSGWDVLQRRSAARPGLQPAQVVAPKQPGACRGLTPGEIALARKAFADKIPYKRVMICRGTAGNPIAWIAFRNGNPAITLGKSIYIADGYSEDYSKAGPKGVELLMHELTHVWQYGELGIAPFLLRYVRELAASGFDANATYDYEPGKTPFGGATLEAQAEMIGDYEEAKARGDEEGARLIERNLHKSGLHGL